MSLLKRTALLSFLLFPLVSFSQGMPAAEASKHVGELGTVCGKIAETYTGSASRGVPTYVDFEKPYPNQAFTAVVWQRDKERVGNLPGVGSLCVKGTIIEVRGRLEIVIHAASDWSIPASHVSSTAPPESEPRLSNDNHYRNSDGVVVHSPAYSSGGVPTGATAQCGDGTYSFSQHRRGTCSHHGGVAKWF